jgi:hypothetical protein
VIALAAMPGGPISFGSYSLRWPTLLLEALRRLGLSGWELNRP